MTMKHQEEFNMLKQEDNPKSEKVVKAKEVSNEKESSTHESKDSPEKSQEDEIGVTLTLMNVMKKTSGGVFVFKKSTD